MNAVESSERTATLTPANFQRLARFVTSELGIKMPDVKLSMLQGRLQRRLRALGITSIDEYQKRLFDSPDSSQEIAHFIDAVTTNKTDFFREPRHFEYLAKQALPHLDSQPRQPWRLKLWCAGCSSGEEAYTLSMVLSELGRESFDFSILATDISTRVLEIGRQAIYDESRIEPVPQALRKRYLLRSRDPAKQSVRIVPHLRQRVSFSRLNFMDSEYPVKDAFEVIFFRNVMIYFDKATQEAVINKLCRNLAPGGFLFVGHSESLAGLRVPLSPVGSAIYRKVG